MSVPLAFIGVIAIWSTTPLAIKWSGEGPGFLFGVTGRMVIGALVCLLVLNLLRLRLPWHGEARRAYLASTLATFAAMMCVYAGAQHISSGQIAILFGISPMLTAIFAAKLLGERSLTAEKLAGILFALAGLVVIVGKQGGDSSLLGVTLVLTAATVHALSTVLVKRVNAQLPAFTVTTGGLTLTAPLYFITWLVFEGGTPPSLPGQALGAIVYLGLIGSVVGYWLYYYVLHHTQASTVGLIPLITPVLAIGLGHLANHEAITAQMVIGTLLVLTGLALHQWGGALVRTTGAGQR
ncbi:MAG: DMT family transporter [Granulosicoccaceae bacterium]|jgi:drug/metabolite transporter (DMT)-like permease